MSTVAWAMSSQLQAVPSIGHPNFKLRQLPPPWKQKSLPWEVIAVISYPSLPCWWNWHCPLCMSLSMRTTKAHWFLLLHHLLTLSLQQTLHYQNYLVSWKDHWEENQGWSHWDLSSIGRHFYQDASSSHLWVPSELASRMVTIIVQEGVLSMTFLFSHLLPYPAILASY